jgi:hypothetical protein
MPVQTNTQVIADPLVAAPCPKNWNISNDLVAMYANGLWFSVNGGVTTVFDITGKSRFRASWLGLLEFENDKPANALGVNFASPDGEAFFARLLNHHKSSWVTREKERIARHIQSEAVKAEKRRKKGSKKAA